MANIDLVLNNFSSFFSCGIKLTLSIFFMRSLHLFERSLTKFRRSLQVPLIGSVFIHCVSLFFRYSISNETKLEVLFIEEKKKRDLRSSVYQLFSNQYTSIHLKDDNIMWQMRLISISSSQIITN